MRLHFSRPGVERLLKHAKEAPEHRHTYGQSGKVAPGLWLVGDQGVYLMSNGHPALDADPPKQTKNSQFVVYASEVDPTKLDFDVWYDAKRASFGGDDGCEYLTAESVEQALSVTKPGASLMIDVSSRGIMMFMPKKSRRAA